MYNQGPLFNPHQDHVILSKCNPNMALDCSKDPEDKHKLILWNKHGKNNQRFKFPYHNGKYMIVSQDHGQVVEVPKDSNESGKKIKAGKQSNSMGEQWEFVPVQGQPNTYFIKSFCGKCLDADGGKTDPGTNIIQWDYNGGENQMWIIKPEEGPKRFHPNHNFIVMPASNRHMALDVSQDPQAKGKMILWNKHGQQNQLWRIEEHNNRFVLHSCVGGVLHIANGNNGTHAGTGHHNKADGDFWYVEPVFGKNHTFYIRSFCGKALDVSEGKTDPNTHIIQWDYHGGDNQQWIIEQA